MTSSIVQPQPTFSDPDQSPSERADDAMISASKSVTGGRDYNEDRCYRCDSCQFYMVADGMGGHRGGALASQIAVETIPLKWWKHLSDKKLSYSAIQAAYRKALEHAAHEMSAVARHHHQYDQMGCTVAAAFLLAGRMYYGNVGDCRVYLCHRTKLTRLTRDDTLVQGLVDAGAISAAEARTHRWRHIVTNSVSARGFQGSPRLRSTPICAGDWVLITSDGMTDELADYEMEQIISQCSNPQECVDQLIAAALDREARDNVSCVVFQI